MALNAKKIESNSKFERPEPLDPGTYPARVVQILSLGLQTQRPFQGKEKPPQQEIMVTYEFLDEFMTDKETGEEIEDKPRWLSETFPLHSFDADLAKSTKRYLALDPKQEHDGDWAALAGVPCMVTITQNKSKKDESVIYENITGVSAMRPKEAAKAEELKNPPKVFDIDEPDMEVFGSLPKWIQDKMKDNLEFEGSALEKAIKKNPDVGSSEDKKKEDKKSKEKVKEAEKSDEEEEDGDDW